MRKCQGKVNTMDRRIRKVMYPNPTFDDVEEEFEGEKFKDPGPGLAREATSFVLSQFYTRSFDEAMGSAVGTRRSVSW